MCAFLREGGQQLSSDSLRVQKWLRTIVFPSEYGSFKFSDALVLKLPHLPEILPLSVRSRKGCPRSLCACSRAAFWEEDEGTPTPVVGSCSTGLRAQHLKWTDLNLNLCSPSAEYL